MARGALAGVCAASVCVLLHASPSFAAADIVLYASDAVNLQGNWTRAADQSAAGGQLITSADAGWASADAPLASPASFFEFTFSAPANTPYHVWLRLRAGSDSKWNDSIWAQFSDALSASGAALYPIGSTTGLLVNGQSCSGCALSGWGWIDSAYWLTSQSPIVRFAGSGSHTLRVQIREDGVQIDQVVLSPAQYLNAAPGAVTNDATIVAKNAAASPFFGAAAAIPGTIQAEDFDNGGEGIAYHDTSAGNSGAQYRATDVDIESATDGAYDVGWIAPGEWLAYTVNVTTGGSYLLEARVAALGQGGTFHVEFGGVDATGALTIPNTGGWQNWTTISRTVRLNAGQQTMRVAFDTNGAAAVGNVTWFRLTQAGANGGGAFGGSPAPVPGTVHAENFDLGSEGVAYHDTSAGNAGGQYRNTDVDIENSGEGGYDVGWTADGEWLAYTVNVAAAGSYTIQVRVASPYSSGALHLSFNGVNTTSVAVPNTGGWQRYTNVTIPATLSAGTQVMKLFVETGGFNLSTISIAPVASPVGGRTISVPAGGDLQAAINNASPGDTILVQAGATFTGNFVLPAKDGSSMITIRSSAPDSSLPLPNTRIDPSYSPQLPKLRSPNSVPALSTAPGAHHYTLMGLEFPSTLQGLYIIVALGDGSPAQNTLASVPHDLVLDRVYVHGDVTFGQKCGIAMNSASTTVMNSYVSEIKAVGQDSQAIGGTNGPGPFMIVNNYLEAAGENILFGGNDPPIPNLIPSDITVRGNLLTKQLAWRSQSWSVKNIFELKNAQRVVIDGNVLENNWIADQSGYAVLFTPRNQDGNCPWCTVQQIQFTNNLVRHVSSGINMLGTDNLHASGVLTAVTVRNNLFEDVSGATWGGSGRFMIVGNGARNVTIDHNSIFQDGTSALYAYGAPTTGFVFTNNIIPDNSWAVMGDSTSPGNGTIAAYFPGSLFQDNIFAGSNPASYPANNYFPASLSAVSFVNLAGGNYRLSSASLYRHAATDGADVGCNIDTLDVAAGIKY